MRQALCVLACYAQSLHSSLPLSLQPPHLESLYCTLPGPTLGCFGYIPFRFHFSDRAVSRLHHIEVRSALQNHAGVLLRRNAIILHFSISPIVIFHTALYLLAALCSCSRLSEPHCGVLCLYQAPSVFVGVC